MRIRDAQITPYIWATGLGGSVTPLRGGPKLDFDESFSDVLEDLDAAFFVSGYARQGRFVLVGDYSYSSSSRGGTVPRLGLPVRGRVEQSSATLAAGYRAVQRPEGSLDVLAGLRRWEIDAAVKTPVPVPGAGVDVDFFDPIVALRTRITLSETWSLIGYLDIGGFGVGSDLTAQAVATVNWQANENIYLSVGYRHLFVDYDSGGRAFDVTFTGPLLGLTYRF